MRRLTLHGPEQAVLDLVSCRRRARRGTRLAAVPRPQPQRRLLGFRTGNLLAERRAARSLASDRRQGFSAPVVAQNKVIVFHRIEQRKESTVWTRRTARLCGASMPLPYSDSYGRGDKPSRHARNRRRQGFHFRRGQACFIACGSQTEKLWSVDTKEKFKPQKGFFGVATSPLVEGHLVLLNVSAKIGPASLPSIRPTAE